MKHGKFFVFGVLAMTLAFSLVLAACDTGGGGDDEGGNTLPSAKGANALSGKIYVEWDRKIEFSTTAEGAENGTYKKLAVKRDENWNEVLVNGKYTYTEIETGYYSWDETAKTVTISPAKIAFNNSDGYGPLQTKAEYRTAAQTWINDYTKQYGQAIVNQQLASAGFSSAAAYIDYVVAEAFKNVTNNYAFSADNKALFLDEALPANKGTNELAGQTYYGTTWSGGDNGQEVKDPSQGYVFTDIVCTYTQTWDNSPGYTETYAYTYDSTTKRVYLKIPTTNRNTDYNNSNYTDSGYFASADEYKAAQVNSQYNQMRDYRYDTKEKTLN